MDDVNVMIMNDKT